MTLTRLETTARRAVRDVRDWSRDEDGLEAVEWVLLVAGGVVPLAVMMFRVMQAIVFYYAVANWTISLPFP